MPISFSTHTHTHKRAGFVFTLFYILNVSYVRVRVGNFSQQTISRFVSASVHCACVFLFVNTKKERRERKAKKIGITKRQSTKKRDLLCKFLCSKANAIFFISTLSTFYCMPGCFFFHSLSCVCLFVWFKALPFWCHW